MTEKIQRFSYAEFSAHLAEILHLVVDEQQAVEVEIETGQRAMLTPVPPVEDAIEGSTEKVKQNTAGQNDPTWIEDLQALRQRILLQRNGKVVEGDWVNRVRDERDDELSNLY